MRLAIPCTVTKCEGYVRLLLVLFPNLSSWYVVDLKAEVNIKWVCFSTVVAIPVTGYLAVEPLRLLSLVYILVLMLILFGFIMGKSLASFERHSIDWDQSLI